MSPNYSVELLSTIQFLRLLLFLLQAHHTISAPERLGLPTVPSSAAGVGLSSLYVGPVQV